MTEHTFRTIPQLETDRLILKEISHSDAHGVYQLFTDERVVKTFGYRMGRSLPDAHDLIDHWRRIYEAGEGVRWGMYLKPSMKLIGNLGFKNVNDGTHVSVGYALLPYYWRNGLTSEALSAIIAYAFSAMNITKIEASVLTVNTSSILLLNKLGFTRTAYLKQNYFFDNAFHDVYVYTIDNKYITSI
ncbi:MAG: GNAT family protein [Flavipsychrobacter sp.]|nr:GNAT family protein [Flavipsychrobacter sp.]